MEFPRLLLLICFKKYLLSNVEVASHQKEKSANCAPQKLDSVRTQLSRRLPSERGQTLISPKEKWFSGVNFAVIEKSCR